MITFSARITETQHCVSEAIIANMTYTRQQRVAVLEASVDRKLARREYRAGKR
jgi:hypothetical protein